MSICPGACLFSAAVVPAVNRQLSELGELILPGKEKSRAIGQTILTGDVYPWRGGDGHLGHDMIAAAEGAGKQEGIAHVGPFGRLL